MITFYCMNVIKYQVSFGAKTWYLHMYAKRSLLPWLHSHAFHRKSEMVWSGCEIFFNTRKEIWYVQPCYILYIFSSWYGVMEMFPHMQLSNLLVMFYQSKFQKHQAFEAEVSANQERVLETINLAEGEWQWSKLRFISWLENGIKFRFFID